MAMTMRLTPSMYNTFKQDFESVDSSKEGSLDQEGVLRLMTMQLARTPSTLELQALRIVLAKEAGNRLSLDQYVDFIAGENQSANAQKDQAQGSEPARKEHPSITAQKLKLAEKVADSYKPKLEGPPPGTGLEVAVSADELKKRMNEKGVPARKAKEAKKVKDLEAGVEAKLKNLDESKMKQSSKLEKRRADKEKPVSPKPEPAAAEVYAAAAQSGSLAGMSVQEAAVVANNYKNSKEEAESRLQQKKEKKG